MGANSYLFININTHILLYFTPGLLGETGLAMGRLSVLLRFSLFLRVRTFPKESAVLGRETVRALMYYALKVWSDITPLNFHEVAGNTADIQIDFTKADHNDGYPFDGPGGTVAHAFFPGERFTAGDTHFDDDEAWTFRSPGKSLKYF